MTHDTTRAKCTCGAEHDENATGFEHDHLGTCPLYRPTPNAAGTATPRPHKDDDAHDSGYIDECKCQKKIARKPWTLSYDAEYDESQALIFDGDDNYVATVTIHQIPREMGRYDEARRLANAALIVEAVNAYEGLKGERDQFKQVAADNLATNIEYARVNSSLKSKLAEMERALKDVLANSGGDFSAKSCKHPYHCNCPWDNAREALRGGK